MPKTAFDAAFEAAFEAAAAADFAAFAAVVFAVAGLAVFAEAAFATGAFPAEALLCVFATLAGFSSAVAVITGAFAALAGRPGRFAPVAVAAVLLPLSAQRPSLQRLRLPLWQELPFWQRLPLHP